MLMTRPRDPASATPTVQAARKPHGADEIFRALVPEALSVAGSGPRRLIAELTVPVSHERADLAMVTDQIWCYEIKSARDTLRRLPRQIAAFQRVAHRCVAVVATKHLDAAEAQLPRHWGVVEADGRELLWHRQASRNDQVELKSLLRLLWRQEAARALEELDGVPREGRRRQSLLGELWRTLDSAAIDDCVCRALLARSPYEGRVAAHSRMD